MDLKSGIAIEEIADGGMLAGDVDGEAVVLVRQGKEVFALWGRLRSWLRIQMRWGRVHGCAHSNTSGPGMGRAESGKVFPG